MAKKDDAAAEAFAKLFGDSKPKRRGRKEGPQTETVNRQAAIAAAFAKPKKVGGMLVVELTPAILTVENGDGELVSTDSIATVRTYARKFMKANPEWADAQTGTAEDESRYIVAKSAK
jgi:hypothetical protein